MKYVELLAPAKDKDVAICAINYGADAVYIGAEAFGARRNAGNSISDIEKVVRYSHLYNAKVYVTLNTLLRDEELDQAQILIKNLYEVGVDALIVQDFGLLELDLPPIPLHASTQMHNNTVDKIKFLEQVGFQRVILPRESSLEWINEVKKECNIELESFVHGALCVSYSGQCYMSQAIGGRSANRGECAQPCRKKYTLIDAKGNVLAKGKHLLSLKDLNLSEELEPLMQAGVSSFKIEGRLKDEAYVKNVVGAYRRKLDDILEGKTYEKSSSGVVNFDFEPDLNKTFNREYCKYFFNGRNKDITQFRTSKSLGESLGKIVIMGKNSFKLASKEKLYAGDGICFFDKSGELKGTQVNEFKNGFIFVQNTKGLEKGIFLYRNFNQEFTKKLKSSKTNRKISVDVKVFERENQLVFEVIDEDKIKASLGIENDFEEAKNEQKAFENIKKQMQKLGETSFSLRDFESSLSNTPFIPISKLNEIRRELVELLAENRFKAYDRKQYSFEKTDVLYPEKELSFNSNVLNKKAKEFYSRHCAEVLEMATESGLNMHGKVVMTTKHCLRYSLGRCLKQTKDNDRLYIVDEKNYKYELEFDCEKCQMKVLY